MLFFLVGCAGCGFLLLLVGVGGTMAWLLFQQNRGARTELPVGWQDSLRARYRFPDLAARLATPASDSGDVWAVIDSLPADAFTRDRQRAVRHLLTPGALTRDDSAAIRGTLHDSAAALVASAARRSRYGFAPFLDSATALRLLPPLGTGLQIGRLRPAGAATDPLILRGEARRWHGDARGAREDFAAVIAIGRLSWFGEMSTPGAMLGRRAIESGAAGLSRVAAQTHDRPLATAADSLRAWAVAPVSFFEFRTLIPPDSLVLVASDSSLPRGVRASALENACWGALYDPMWRLIAGPSSNLMTRVHALTHDADPYVARAALMADRTLARLDDMGVRNRYRVASGKSVR